MEDIRIESTKYTPRIVLDKKGVVDIRGKSYPENTYEFYAPLMRWVEAFFENPESELAVNLEIVYFNSSTSKFLFDFFDLLDENRQKCHIVIRWIYDEENEPAQEAGEEFREDFEALDFRLVSK